MENEKEKKIDLTKVNPRKAARIGVVALIAALLLTLCIFIGMRSNIQKKYSDARMETGEQLYTQMYMLCQTFDQITVPGVNIQEDVIPKMQDYYNVSKALNNVMIRSYGQRYEVLTESDLAATDAAFEAFDAAFRTGKPTDDAQSAMQTVIAQVRNLLDTRFKDGVICAK